MKKSTAEIKIRIPTPKPTKFHSSPKGAKGYDRKRAKEEFAFLKRIRSSPNLEEEKD